MKAQVVPSKLPHGGVERKTFSDITNTVAQPKSGCQGDVQHKGEYVDKLLKENVAMMKTIEEKNKIIELSGDELQKLRIHLQKLKLQNWTLAQTNSQMQAEVNAGRQRLKALQHELACKDVLLKARMVQEETTQKEKIDADMSKVMPEVKEDTIIQHEPKVIKDEKPVFSNRSRTIRSRSMSSSTIKQVAEQETAEMKRPYARRQSARFKSEQQENTFEIDDVKFSDSRNKSQTPPRRSSIGGRPPRKAAEKVQTYKEIPLNIKLRRNG